MDRGAAGHGARGVSAAEDGNALRTRRTTERVLAESLRLFNAHGEPNVTTGAIADSLGMSPGNLYYHFRNKDQIVEALCRRLEARLDIAPQAEGGGEQALEDLWLYLHLTLEGIWEYRFAYRNLDDLAARSRRLRDLFNRVLDRQIDAVESLCRAMARAHLMAASPEEMRGIAHNVVVVATYWLNFQSVRRRGAALDADDRGAGAYQVLSLVAPYLQGAARAHLDALGRRYLA